MHSYYLIFNLFSLTLCHGLVNAPYQVGVFLFDNYNPSFGSKNFAVCSAAIVHPLFCVTTADCVHAHITSQNIARPFLPTSIYIKSGNFSEIRENIKYVKAIFVHPEFNSSSFENDIALIQVESSFQFDHVYNERWVQLPDYTTVYSKCIFSINRPNLGSAEIYPFCEPKQTMVENSSMCHGTIISYLAHIESIDLCSFYEFDHSFMCQIPESQLRLNRDRGTPLICDNKLAGLLSVIIPSNVTNSTTLCSETLKTRAYYTKVVLYEKWIHSLIAINTPEHTADGQPIPVVPISPPYQNILTVANPMGPNTAAPSTAGSIILSLFGSIVTCYITYFVL